MYVKDADENVSAFRYDFIFCHIKTITYAKTFSKEKLPNSISSLQYRPIKGTEGRILMDSEITASV